LTPLISPKSRRNARYPMRILRTLYVFLLEMDAKRMELLRELVPNPALIAVPEPDKVQNGVGGNRRGGTRGRSTHRARRGSNEREIHSAFKRIELLRPQPLLVGADPFFNSRRVQLVTLAKE
jgi:hypothetical protein